MNNDNVELTCCVTCVLKQQYSTTTNNSQKKGLKIQNTKRKTFSKA